MMPITAVHSGKPFVTTYGTKYLRDPGVLLVGWPQIDLTRTQMFLEDMDPTWPAYLKDDRAELSDAELLCKFAGQLCYHSFGPNRTPHASAERYFQNILDSGHGSILEHANFTFLLYGISRSCSHEFVRHRAGFGFSQLSQRYVDDKHLRFVERSEYQEDSTLHPMFEAWIDQARSQYMGRVERLLDVQLQTSPIELASYSRTDLRKHVQQSARECLPNETETQLLVTANVRAWRHFIAQRASVHADTAIRQVAYLVFMILRTQVPSLFQDMHSEKHTDGTRVVYAGNPKV